MSNLFKPQLYPCQSAPTLRSFPPFALLWFNYILSYPTPCSYPIFSLFLHLYLLVLSPVMASGSTLTHPSARAQTNQSRVVLCHKDQKQLVSSHVSRFFLSACAATSVCVVTQEFAEVHECLPDFFIPLSMNYDFSAWLVHHPHTFKFPHTWFQAWLQSKEGSFDCFLISVSGSVSLTVETGFN